MKQPPEKPLTKREIRGFFLRAFVLLALTGLVWWAGWKSPWAQADRQVQVVTVATP